METYTVRYSEPSEAVKVAGEYDVVVIGGGVAGVAAALAARRCGCSSVILEKGTMMGGLATMGLITWYLPLCDGHGRKIISGIAEELLYKSIEYGYDTLPAEWRGGPAKVENPSGRYKTRFSPAEFNAAMEEMLKNEGVDFVYDTLFTAPVMEDGRCKAVLVEEAGGKRAYLGKVFIDASGDCDLACRAGADTADSDNNISYWTYNTDMELLKKAVETEHILDAMDVHWYGDIPRTKEPKLPLVYVRNAEEVTEYVVKGRKCFLDDIKAKGKGQDHASLVVGSMPQVRTTKRIEGEYTLTPDDVNKHFEDSVGAICDWRKPGPVYEIPYRSLYSPKIKNVFTAGRCIAAKDDAWEVTRVIPPAALTGQASGTAAAMMVRDNTGCAQVDIKALQKKLSEDGVMIHF